MALNRIGKNMIDGLPEDLNNLTQQLAQIATQINADKTGVTFSTLAIKNAIENAQDGENFIVPTGIYKIDDVISSNKNITIDFKGSTIETYNGGGFRFSGTLKSTHSVTSDYVERVSKNSLTLNSVTGIKIGDLINVVSSELYDTSRSYNFKGGNALITGIEENTVYFNLVFPFDMTANSITVKIYDPVTVKIKNVYFEGKSEMQNSYEGLVVEYAKNIVLDNVKTNNYQRNITLNRVVNGEVGFIETGHSAHSTDTWSGYGILINSSNNISIKNSNMNSGGGGVDFGGQEVSFNITIEKSVLKSEHNFGLGMHANIYNSLVRDCSIYSFSAYGNATFENCEIFLSDNQVDNNNLISVADDFRYSNYIFKNCSFPDDNVVLLADYTQLTSLDRKFVGSIIFEDCNNAKLLLNVRNSKNGEKTAIINNIVINRLSKSISISTYDEINSIHINESNSNTDNAIIINQLYSGTYPVIGEIVLNNIEVPRRYSTLSIRNVDRLVLKEVKYNELDFGNGRVNLENIKDIVIENSDLLNDVYGFVLNEIGNLFISNSKLRFYQSLNAQFTKTNRVKAVNFFSVRDNGYMDILTTPSGSKYKITVDDTGNEVRTVI